MVKLKAQEMRAAKALSSGVEPSVGDLDHVRIDKETFPPEDALAETGNKLDNSVAPFVGAFDQVAPFVDPATRAPAHLTPQAPGYLPPLSAPPRAPALAPAYQPHLPAENPYPETPT